MVLPVSLWGCFALATVSLLMLYSYSYKYSDGKMFDTPTSVEKDNLNCCGVKYEFKKTSEILLSNIKTITATAYSAIEPAIKAIGANLKNNEQIQQLTYGAQSVARSAITLGTSQRPALLGTRTTDREPLTENSANGATANI